MQTPCMMECMHAMQVGTDSRRYFSRESRVQRFRWQRGYRERARRLEVLNRREMVTKGVCTKLP